MRQMRHLSKTHAGHVPRARLCLVGRVRSRTVEPPDGDPVADQYVSIGRGSAMRRAESGPRKSERFALRAL